MVVRISYYEQENKRETGGQTSVLAGVRTEVCPGHSVDIRRSGTI